jgi:predicted nucleic acid-binding protein
MRAGIECFFDTNVLVYYSTDQSPNKRDVANGLVNDALARASGAISAQVMQECVNVLMREDAPERVLQAICERVLRPLAVCDTTPELIESAIEIKQRTKFHLYDALIIAAALACGAKTLYSEDLQHGQRIENLTIINPFL